MLIQTVPQNGEGTIQRTKLVFVFQLRKLSCQSASSVICFDITFYKCVFSFISSLYSVAFEMFRSSLAKPGLQISDLSIKLQTKKFINNCSVTISIHIFQKSLIRFPPLWLPVFCHDTVRLACPQIKKKTVTVVAVFLGLENEDWWAPLWIQRSCQGHVGHVLSLPASLSHAHIDFALASPLP